MLRNATNDRRRRLRTFGRRVRDDESGVALTELALVLPVLLVLVLGMIDFGKAMNYWIDETHLANTAARWAVVNYNPGGSTTAFQAYIRDHADSRELSGANKGTQQTKHAMTVNVCFYKATDGSLTTAPGIGDTVKVTLKYAYNWLGFLRAQEGFSPSTTIGSSSAMRLESIPTAILTSNNTGGLCPATA
jgi:Flp pilus assembly protein TadG